MFHLQEVKAQLTDAHVKNRMKKITCCIFARFIFAKQGILLHMYKGQHFPKTCHEEILYLFHPLPSNNFQGDIEQTKRAICQPSEAKQPVIWTSFAALFCLAP